MPTKIRRSRMCRTPTGKRLVLTPRDLTIFRALRQYRYLRSTYLHAFAGGASATRFKERLGDLFHEGYLDRPEEQWRFARCQHMPVVYELGHGAIQILNELGFGADERRVLLGQGAHKQFLHSLMICEVLASIELAAQSAADLRFIPVHEILGKAPRKTQQSPSPLRLATSNSGDHVIPDAIFGLEYQSGTRSRYRFFAVEADRGTMPIRRRRKAQTSICAKLVSYRELLSDGGHRRYFGIPNLLVLTIMEAERRKETALTNFDITQGFGAAFLFKAVPNLAVPLTTILNLPWQRPQYSGIRLDIV